MPSIACPLCDWRFYGRFFADHPVVRRFAVQLRKDATFRIEAYADPRDFRDFLTLVAAQQIVTRRGRSEVAA